MAIPGDVSTPEGAAALAAGHPRALRALDILVNNAGATWGAPLEEFPAGGWDRVAHTNVEGVFHLTVAPARCRCAPRRAPRTRRASINIGSIDGLRTPSVENYSYSASKAAVHMLTRHLAKRLAGEHITVNAIAPGPFESKMMAFLLDRPRDAGDGRAERPARPDRPARRRRRPDPCSSASRAGAYMTGTVIPLDGGHHRLRLNLALGFGIINASATPTVVPITTPTASRAPQCKRTSERVVLMQRWRVWREP